MGRRSDHTRAELEALILSEGQRLMAEAGYAQFSAREVAKRIGYSIGTIYNVYGSHHRLVLAINMRTLALWADEVQARLAEAPADRIAALVESYFAFATAHPNRWMAVYEHRMPPGEEMPGEFREALGRMIGIAEDEIRRLLPSSRAGLAAPLARSLIATVHGHCFFALTGTFALLGETEPQAAALARVRAALAAVG